MEDNPTPAKKPTRKGTIPKTDIDLGAVATHVTTKWAENSWLTLKWVSHAEYETAVNYYNAELSGRMQIGSSRPAITAALREMELEFDMSMRFIKAYLFDKYGTKAKDHYHAFGLVKVGNALMLPRDQNQRSEALSIALQAISSEGFDDKQYGNAYWLEKINAYNALLLQAKSIDSNVASKVGHKNEYRATVIRGLNSLIHVLRGNFPDTYAAEIRSWGFQKEKY